MIWFLVSKSCSSIHFAYRKGAHDDKLTVIEVVSVCHGCALQHCCWFCRKDNLPTLVQKRFKAFMITAHKQELI